MAVDLYNEEFWLPSQFLTDGDKLLEKKKVSQKYSSSEPEARTCFPWEIRKGYGSCVSSSGLSSPFESELGSTETESEEDDYIAELARQMAHYMLQEDDENVVPTIGSESPKSWGLAGSPQSTLCGFVNGSGSRWASNRERPKSPSHEPSPPMKGKGDTWDMLHDAAGAGNLLKMKINDDGPTHHHRLGFLGTPIKPISDPASVKNPNVGSYSTQPRTDYQLRAIEFYRLKQEQLLKQQRGRRAKVSETAKQCEPKQQQQLQLRACDGFGNGRSVCPLGTSSSSAWPLLQHQQQKQQASRPGMIAIFLEGSGSRKGSCGTGVFLPRGVGSPSEFHTKPGCSTVLIPARVVQALKLDFNEMGVLSPSNAGCFPLQHDASMARTNGLFSQQKRHSRTLPGIDHQEMGLPQD